MPYAQFLPTAVTAAVFLVVVFLELLKKADKKNKLKGKWVFVSTGLSLLFAVILFVGGFFTAPQIPFYWAAIFGSSAFGYEGILKQWPKNDTDEK